MLSDFSPMPAGSPQVNRLVFRDFSEYPSWSGLGGLPKATITDQRFGGDDAFSHYCVDGVLGGLAVLRSAGHCTNALLASVDVILEGGPIAVEASPEIWEDLALLAAAGPPVAAG